MPHAVLTVAILFEVIGTSFLMASQQFTRFWPTLGMGASYLLSFYFLSQALKVLPLGVAYAVWTGIGASGSVAAGLLLFGETLGTGRLLAILAIVGGVAALKILPG